VIHAAYIVPRSSIDPLYTLQSLACIFIIILVILYSFIELNKTGRLILTFTSIAIILVHYTIIYMASRYVEIQPLPLLLLEETGKGAVIEPDYGQIIFISLLILWRREILGLVKQLREKYMQRQTEENK